jgi:hypothetical protein
MGDWSKGRLNLAADWANCSNEGLTDLDLASGRTAKVQWAGRTQRIRVRAGRRGPRLDLLPSPGSRLLGLSIVGFLSPFWVIVAGGSSDQLLLAVRAELADPASIRNSIAIALCSNLVFLPFILFFLIDHAWSFEPQRATKRLNLLGVPVRHWTYTVIDARDRPDCLLLRTTKRGDVAVRPVGLRAETDDVLMPPELRRIVRSYLAIPRPRT